MQLFNTVNLVNEVILQPRQVQQVILTFRPLESSSDASEHERDFKEGQREIELSSDAVSVFFFMNHGGGQGVQRDLLCSSLAHLCMFLASLSLQHGYSVCPLAGNSRKWVC